MKVYGGLATCFCLAMHCLAGAQSDAPPLSADEKSVVEGNNAFAVDLYRQLDKQDGNLFFSPASISTALGMVYAGARGATATEMAQTMHFGLDQKVFQAAMGAVFRRTAGNSFYELREGNALWLQDGFEFRPEFLTLTKDNYAATLEHVDFRGASEAARATINKTVAQQTNGKIADLLPRGALSRSTKMVLTNAIYFKGDWVTPFDAKRTTTDNFHVTREKDVSAPFMHRQGSFKYYDGGTFQLLAMPYKSGELSLIVFLPKDPAGLNSFEESLAWANMTNWLAALEQPNHEVDVTLPKFKATLEFDLKTSLQKMGMQQAFDGRADFSGITAGRTLSISAVKHKAYIAVDEKGSEAAAATAVGMTAMAMRMPVPPIVFRADHPFFFLIRDSRSGSILFLGRVTDPSKE